MKYDSVFDFSDKVVCITGGLGLIGQKVSEAFSQFNAKVIICDLESKILEFTSEHKGQQLLCENMDIADRESIENCIDRIREKHKRIDVWVNLAYPHSDDWGEKLENVPLESFNENCNSHLGGYFWTSKKVLEIMKKQGCGSLINCSSIYGVVAPDFSIYSEGMTMPVAYSAIKAGIINLSKYLAASYGEYGVRVNCICPGGVENGQESTFIKNYSEKTPLNRMAKAEEIAMPILFLGSEASSYITGETLMVDGGWTCK
jgi:NAD(P)-dependent dehydrogenase (short-subunit alcohol dehydrogenase family)